MTGTKTNAASWDLPPAEPDIQKNLEGYLRGLQSLRKEADLVGDHFEDRVSRGTKLNDMGDFNRGLSQLSDHLGELISRMEDDNFFPVGPEHDPPVPEAKDHAMSYIKTHPGTPRHVLTWLLRCTYEFRDSLIEELLRAGEIREKNGVFYAGRNP